MPEDEFKKVKRRYRIWLLQANFDLGAAELSMHNKYYEWACYQSVQSVEKALKAVLIHAGWRPPMTHKLGILLSMANQANKLFEQVKFNFRKLEAYTFVSRYPFVYPGQNLPPHELISRQDAETALGLARDIYRKIEDFLQQNQIKAGEVVDMEHYYFTEQEVKDRINQIIKELSEDQDLKVQKIILFGSYARERVRPKTSTMDILILAHTSMSFIERIRYVRELTRGGEPIVEPIIYTPEEFDVMLKDEGEGFLESALEEGRVIYQKS